MESMYSVAGYISVPDADLEISKGGVGGGGWEEGGHPDPSGLSLV